jgi:UDP-N-acetylmuramate--alanine ligase
MEVNEYAYYYFLGIGGIGMSALARYFKHQGKSVAGYDRTQSNLTNQLAAEGIDINYLDTIDSIPESVKEKKTSVLVIYTPAIPKDNMQLNFFIRNNYNVLKRSEVLGMLFSQGKGIAISGTHGKTTTSTMVAHILKQSLLDCSAFLGGISINYNSNLLLSSKSDYIVAEADEYDRSFLRLFPTIAVITSIDPDHLDIYGTYQEIIKAFEDFISQIKDDGVLIYKEGIKANININPRIKKFSYSLNPRADFYAENPISDGKYQLFDLHTPWNKVSQLILPLPGRMNLENAVAACAASLLAGVTEDELRQSLLTFSGVKRRFEYYLDTPEIKLIDDYAHHPEEIKACIQTAKSIYPGYKITGIFQPHLFSRTRDLAAEFAESLSLLDEVVLLDIYPAREQPIEGVSSKIIFDKITAPSKILTTKDNLIDELKKLYLQVVITMGAGDIDRLVEPIKNFLQLQYPEK